MGLPQTIADSFRAQAARCRKLGSPFMARLSMLLSEVVDERTETGRRVLGWAGEAEDDALTLRLAGGLHWLVRTGRAPALAAAYPPNSVPEPQLRAALVRTVAEHDPLLLPWLSQPPQTNEVARSGVLMGGLQLIAAETGAALSLHEIGACAGLNLMPEAWSYELGEERRWGPANGPLIVACDWRGSPPPLRRLCFAARSGCDLAPVEPSDDEARQRLISYIWPDQAGRIARAEAALAHAARCRVRVERADAAAWVEDTISGHGESGVCRVLMQSILWRYLDEATQRRLTLAMVVAGSTATRSRPLAWLRMEPDQAFEEAAVILTTWPGGRTREIGRADFHGRYVIWSGER